MEAVKFWARVEIKTGGCWRWRGPVNRKGYGMTDGRLAHRVAWELTRGPIPQGLLCCHTCDTPPCVNPEHLFLGTAQDNARDALWKDRVFRKVAQRDRQVIWSRVAAGESIEALAREFRVSEYTIRQYSRGARRRGRKAAVSFEMLERAREFARAGWTMREIGEELGVSHVTVRNYLHGARNPER